jgi:hypothetical protein
VWTVIPSLAVINSPSAIVARVIISCNAVLSTGVPKKRIPMSLPFILALIVLLCSLTLGRTGVKPYQDAVVRVKKRAKRFNTSKGQMKKSNKCTAMELPSSSVQWLTSG